MLRISKAYTPSSRVKSLNTDEFTSTPTSTVKSLNTNASQGTPDLGVKSFSPSNPLSLEAIELQDVSPNCSPVSNIRTMSQLEKEGALLSKGLADHPSILFSRINDDEVKVQHEIRLYLNSLDKKKECGILKNGRFVLIKDEEERRLITMQQLFSVVQKVYNVDLYEAIKKGTFTVKLLMDFLNNHPDNISNFLQFLRKSENKVKIDFSHIQSVEDLKVMISPPKKTASCCVIS